MKKVALVGLLAVLALTGCGAVKKGSNESDVNIKILQNKSEITSDLKKLASEYSDEHESVSIEIVGGGDDYNSTLQSSFSSGDGPTIFTVFPGVHFNSYQEYMSPLDSIEQVKKTDEMTIKLASKDDKVYGMPVAIEGLGLIYNKKLLTELGFTLDDFATEEDFIRNSKTVFEKGYTAVELAPEKGFIGEHLSNVPYAMQPDPLEFVEKIKGSKENIATNTDFLSWVNIFDSIQKTSKTDILGSSYDQQINNFANGKSLFMHNGNWVEPVFKDYDIDFDYGFAPLPVSGNKKLSVFVPTYWVVNNKSSEAENKAAQDFLNWLYSDEEAQTILVESMGLVPPYSNFSNLDKLSPLSKDVYEAYSSDNALPWSLYFAGQPVLDAIASENQMWFSNEQTGKDTLEKTQKAFESE